MKQKGIASIFLILIFVVVMIGGYVLYTRGSVFLPTSPQIQFDPEKHLKITIIDAVTNKGVEGVPIYFTNICVGTLDIGRTRCDQTFGGKYEQIPSGKTDVHGVLLVIKNEKTPPANVFQFNVGAKPGYNTDTGAGRFLWEDGERSEVTYKIIPSSESSGGAVIDANSAIAAVEADKNFQTWKSQMERVEKPHTDVQSGQWRVYYQGIKNNRGDWLIIFYVDPKTGKVTSYEELGPKVLSPFAPPRQN
ncbi:MAG: hypothetical protein Q7S76_02145 [bacterium]|nr:hypothetical protein [bacterium]